VWEMGRVGDLKIKHYPLSTNSTYFVVSDTKNYGQVRLSI
jgi:hypothetical protein